VGRSDRDYRASLSRHAESGARLSDGDISFIIKDTSPSWLLALSVSRCKLPHSTGHLTRAKRQAVSRRYQHPSIDLGTGHCPTSAITIASVRNTNASQP